MENCTLKNIYYDKIFNLGFFPSTKRLKYKFNFIFGNIDFNDKIVLDIGGGIGLYSFYAAIMGAKKVICLEPESSGSYSKLENKFDLINSKLNLNNVFFINETFQTYKNSDTFDIIISINSINHLNENACIKLRNSKKAKTIYKNIFNKLNKISKKNAKLIICDCSDVNFYNLIGIKNIFAPSIEWEKHKSPNLWTKLLENSGFKKLNLKWSSPNRLGKLGNLFMGNFVISYLINSHFCLYFKKEYNL